MADTDNVASETVANESLKNDANPSVEQTLAPSPSKEENQTIMRLAQEKRELEEKLAARERADADARAKKLEEEGQLKEALAVERAEKQRLLDERTAAEERAALTQSTEEVLSKFSPAVVDIAKTAGLSLVDDSDEAKTSLEAKLNDIAGKLGSTAKVEANNPSVSTPPAESREALVGAMGDPSLRPHEREKVANKFISGLDSVKAMKASVGYPTEPQ